MLKHGTRQPNLTIGLYELKVPQTHLLRRIAAVVDFSFINGMLEETYHKTLGRPAKEPELMLKLLFLEFLYDLSDEQVVARTETDLAFLWFLGMLPEDHPPEASLLSRFRRERLGEERSKKILANLIDQCKQKGLISSERVLVDSTDMSADAAVDRPIHVLRRVTKKLIQAVRAEDGHFAEGLQAEVARYDSAQSEAELRQQATADLTRAIRTVSEAVDKGQLASAAVKQRLKVAQQVAEEGPARVASATDTDARFGRKGRFGYQQQMAMTEDTELILGVRITPGNHSDVQELVPLIDDVAEAHPDVVESVTADRGYDSEANRKELRDRGIESFIAKREPETGKLTRDDFFAPTEFRLNESGRLVCPAGKLSSRTEREPGLPMTRYIFRKRDCSKCPLRERCTNDQRRGRRVKIHDQSLEERQAAWRAEMTRCREAMDRRRAIEHKQAEEVRFHGLRRARYRGLTYVTVQALLTAFVVNAKRMAALLCPLPAAAA
jgi:IS5 family transposase